MGMPIAEIGEFNLLKPLDHEFMPAWVLDDRSEITATTIPEILAKLSQQKIDDGLKNLQNKTT